jgi:septum site-determining protein MinC
MKKMESPDQEKLPAKLKGVGDSLWVTFDPTQSRDRLETALKQIFERLRHLAVNARVILDPGEENGHEALIGDLGTYLRANFAVGMVTAPPPKRSVETEIHRRKELGDAWRYRRSDVLMISGRVRSGQKVEAKKHLVLMGDVNPGGQVTAGGDILVLGRLCGNAVAGHPENETAIVMALDFRPTQVQIGGFVAAGLPAGSDKVAEYAHVEEGKIVVEDYLKADPFSKLPWPEIR